MQQNVLEIREFASRSDAAQAAAQIFADALAEGVTEFGRASFFSSGGSSPTQMLEHLSEHEIDWARIDVGLVDERCVPATQAASNAALVKRHLLRNKAASATFHAMFDENVPPENLALAASETYWTLMPPTALLLGMGADAHTASWFPGAVNLREAYEETAHSVVKIDANGCPGAGEITDRLTLTRAVVAAARCAVLLIFGEEKKRVLEAALSQPADRAPIKAAVEDLGDQLITVWAP